MKLYSSDYIDNVMSNAFINFMSNVFSMCLYALLFGGIIYIGNFGLTTDKHFALSLILGFFAGLLNEINRKIEFFNRDMLEEREKSAFPDTETVTKSAFSDTETVIKDLGKKMAAFSKVTAGKSSEDILSEMRGEESSAWSKEDEKMLNSFLHKLEVCQLLSNKENVWAIRKLKSLRPQTTWKPSEEQIKAVRLARSFVTDDFSDNPTLSEILTELEEQLKKLREA